MDTSDKVTNKTTSENSYASLKNKQVSTYYVISFQKRDAIKETLTNSLEDLSTVTTYTTPLPKKRKTKQKSYRKFPIVNFDRHRLLGLQKDNPTFRQCERNKESMNCQKKHYENKSH